MRKGKIKNRSACSGDLPDRNDGPRDSSEDAVPAIRSNNEPLRRHGRCVRTTSAAGDPWNFRPTQQHLSAAPCRARTGFPPATAAAPVLFRVVFRLVVVVVFPYGCFRFIPHPPTFSETSPPVFGDEESKKKTTLEITNLAQREHRSSARRTINLEAFVARQLLVAAKRCTAACTMTDVPATVAAVFFCFTAVHENI